MGLHAFGISILWTSSMLVNFSRRLVLYLISMPSGIFWCNWRMYIFFFDGWRIKTFKFYYFVNGDERFRHEIQLWVRSNLHCTHFIIEFLQQQWKSHISAADKLKRLNKNFRNFWFNIFIIVREYLLPERIAFPHSKSTLYDYMNIIISMNCTKFFKLHFLRHNTWNISTRLVLRCFFSLIFWFSSRKCNVQ